MTRAMARSTWPVLLLAVGGCSRAADTSPPQIRYGERECECCRMLVSDERFAAALVYADGREVVKVAFDDINCVFSYLADHPVHVPYKVYAHDLETLEWVDARNAVFLRSVELETPMASQIAAAATREGAERLRERYLGRLLTFDEVAALFTPKAADQPTEEETDTP